MTAPSPTADWAPGLRLLAKLIAEQITEDCRATNPPDVAPTPHKSTTKGPSGAPPDRKHRPTRSDNRR